MPFQQNKTKKSPLYHLSTFSLIAIWIGALVWVALNQNTITDWWKLRNYQAPVNISSLSTQDTMTDYGRKLFYINQPSIEAKAVFNNSCPQSDGGEQTIVLGCYHGNQAGIFLLQVKDPRLSGVEQVTAAHEMLHSGYDRLSADERNTINAELLSYYQNSLKDPRIKSVIDAYKKSEPNDVENEMHSVFGTEVANLPAPLEQYYSRYFADRHKVTAFADQYQAEFTSRQAKVASYDNQLNSLKSQITATEAQLKEKQANITSQQAQMVQLRNSNVTAYNAAVPGFNSLVDNYNAQIEQVRSLISRHNQLVAERNAVAVEQDKLINELSSDTQPITGN